MEGLLQVRPRHGWLFLAVGSVAGVVGSFGVIALRGRSILSPFLTALLRRSRVLGQVVKVSFSPWPEPGIVLTHVQLWQWLIDVANERFFFGPLCMPVDFVRADRIVVRLSPGVVWAKRTLPLEVTNFRIAFHRAAEHEWNSARHIFERRAAFTRWRRSHADWVCSLLEPPRVAWSPKFVHWLFDLILAHLDIKVRHLCQRHVGSLRERS